MPNQEGAMKFLYIATYGSEDPTRASLPFMMAKGAKEAGQDVAVALMGESVLLFNETIASSVQGVGLPSLKELMQFSRDNKIPVYG
jgi:predicted peroxiredoxin